MVTVVCKKHGTRKCSVPKGTALRDLRRQLKKRPDVTTTPKVVGHEDIDELEQGMVIEFV